MGLDQNAYINATETSEQDDKGNTYVSIDSDRNFYWRKHSRLQEFMEKLWVEKTGESPVELNCSNLELNLDDIKALWEAVQNNFAEHECEGGFFYGHQFQEEQANHYQEQDTEFCSAATLALEKGQKVIYTCWW